MIELIRTLLSLQTDPELAEPHAEAKAVPEPRIAPSSESVHSGGSPAKQEDNVCMTKGSLVTIVTFSNH